MFENLLYLYIGPTLIDMYWTEFNTVIHILTAKIKKVKNSKQNKAQLLYTYVVSIFSQTNYIDY